MAFANAFSPTPPLRAAGACGLTPPPLLLPRPLAESAPRKPEDEEPNWIDRSDSDGEDCASPGGRTLQFAPLLQMRRAQALEAATFPSKDDPSASMSLAARLQVKAGLVSSSQQPSPSEEDVLRDALEALDALCEAIQSVNAVSRRPSSDSAGLAPHCKRTRSSSPTGFQHRGGDLGLLFRQPPIHRHKSEVQDAQSPRSPSRLPQRHPSSEAASNLEASETKYSLAAAGDFAFQAAAAVTAQPRAAVSAVAEAAASMAGALMSGPPSTLCPGHAVCVEGALAASSKRRGMCVLP
ncbi:unnamed protein product [Polarella glacialis]|uniref:Uncharacterized protein n=1 Tax=Polarella glacialis TaxID=89957 RepID=A0A813JL19_POLGL|nr:unnamed protein product [Polarella glacialis]